MNSFELTSGMKYKDRVLNSSRSGVGVSLKSAAIVGSAPACDKISKHRMSGEPVNGTVRSTEVCKGVMSATLRNRSG